MLFKTKQMGFARSDSSMPAAFAYVVHWTLDFVSP